MNNITRVYPESGDWEAYYLNDKLIAEGHKVNTRDLLDALVNVFPHIFKSIEISDERAEKGFNKNLNDLLSIYKNDCLHLNTESTHPYGWIACKDCGKLL